MRNWVRGALAAALSLAAMACGKGPGGPATVEEAQQSIETVREQMKQINQDMMKTMQQQQKEQMQQGPQTQGQ